MLFDGTLSVSCHTSSFSITFSSLIPLCSGPATGWPCLAAQETVPCASARTKRAGFLRPGTGRFAIDTRSRCGTGSRFRSNIGSNVWAGTRVLQAFVYYMYHMPGTLYTSYYTPGTWCWYLLFLGDIGKTKKNNWYDFDILCRCYRLVMADIGKWRMKIDVILRYFDTKQPACVLSNTLCLVLLWPQGLYECTCLFDE